MSTKIYNGYRLPKMTMDEFQKFIMNTRKIMKESFNSIVEERLALILGDMIDSISLGGIEEFKKRFNPESGYSRGHDLYWKAYFHISSMYEKAKNNKTIDDIEYDFSCEAVFIPIKRKLLCLFYSHQDEYFQSWNNINQVNEYMYYNNCDRPKNISKKQWDTRMNDWNIALGESGIPNNNGFIVKFDTEISPFKLNQESVIAKIPSIEKRAKSHAESIVYEILWQEFIQNQSNSFKTYRLVKKEIESNRGVQLIEQEYNKLLKILKQNITKEDLNMKI